MPVTFSRLRDAALCVAAALALAACTDGADSDKQTVSEKQPLAQQASLSLPPGSWQLSCNNASLSNDVLTASCKTLSGNTTQASLYGVSNCLGRIVQGGDIGNIDGSLICIPDLPRVDASFVFPQSERTINNWVYGGDDEAMYRHGWGIWAGLTQQAGVVDGQPVRAFQTWATPSNMKYRMKNETAPPQRHLDLEPARQFRNKAHLASQAQAQGDGDTHIAVSVAYNPPAANHAIRNRLFLQSTLETFLKEGYEEIPNFPSNAITIKPVYKVINASNTQDGIYTMPGWPGTPSPARTFGEDTWNACVYIDVNGSGSGGSEIDQGCSGRNASNTFYLSNFIHHPVTAADAEYLAAQLSVKVSEGDYVILVGMHVGTREVKRWAWQTFWWSANADQPELPSSERIASLRPAVLDEAARHYAMSVGYAMVSPAQPIIGGKNEGEPVISYNPHLEAGFDPGVFQIKRPINGDQLMEYGVQTNCMTCHGLAFYDPKVDYSADGGANREKPYAADFYMSLDDAVFEGKLKLDFAWSILGVLELDAE
ncbi:hypothetical protein [Isoalcanivorax indicus]|uniref:hypothetical protein n=1 Tax=Isoalcanivorax indicus TaxID=2202653 RepID=UPI000DB9E9C1|nr:hypothetical protein [Isoalcanivorax indicus]